MAHLKNSDALTSALASAAGTSERLDRWLTSIAASTAPESGIKLEQVRREAAYLSQQLRRVLLSYMNQGETASSIEAALNQVIAQYLAPGYGASWFVQFYGETSLSMLRPACRVEMLNWLMERVARDGFTPPELWQSVLDNNGLLPAELNVPTEDASTKFNDN